MQPPRDETGDDHFLLADAILIHFIPKQSGRNPRHPIGCFTGRVVSRWIEPTNTMALAGIDTARCVPGETL
jgi:hypothetical protein